LPKPCFLGVQPARKKGNKQQKRTESSHGITPPDPHL
jgi:hypothetical protein